MTEKKKKNWLKKTLKWTISAVLLLVLLIAAGVYWAYNYYDWKGKVRQLVHQHGSQVVGTSVDIGGIDLSLSSGSGSVSNITVANPKDYSQKYIIKLGNIAVNVNKDSIKKIATETVKGTGSKTKTVVINEILINQPEVTYELMSLKQNNVNDILENIKKNTASAAKPAPKTENKDAIQYNVAIKKVVVSNGVATVAANLLGSSQSLSVNVPTVTITNVGTEGQGVSIEGGLARIFQEILKATSGAVAKADLSGVLNGVTDLANTAIDTAGNAANAAIDTAGNAANAAVDTAGSAANAVTEGVSGGVKSLSDGVGGLFK